MSIFPPGFLERFRQAQQERDRGVVDAAARQPIPGLTGPRMPAVGVPGNLPPVVNPAVPPSAGHQMFPVAGPYGAQAQQLAGLLDTPTMGIPNPPGNVQTQMGLLGPVKGLRVPFYRPPGK
jgi:hypothetical protein